MKPGILRSTCIAIVVLAGCFVLTPGALASPVQDQAGQPQAEAQKPKSAKDVMGPSADSIRPYKPAGRDPFKKTLKPKATNKSGKQAVVKGFPTLDLRRAEFRQKVESARVRDLPEPDPVSQYLVSELDVTGIFRDERGPGAFVRATPTGSMFFLRRGAICYNGEVVRIEGTDADMGASRVVFREVSYLEINGKQAPQERVVAKAPTASQQKN